MKRVFIILAMMVAFYTNAQTPIATHYLQRLSPYELIFLSEKDIFIAGYTDLAPQISRINEAGDTQYFTDLWGGSFGKAVAFNTDQEGRAMFSGHMIDIDTLVFNGDTFYSPVKRDRQYISHLDSNGAFHRGVIFPELFDNMAYVEETIDGYVTAVSGDLIESIHIVHVNSSGKILQRFLGPSALNAGKKPVKAMNDSLLISFGYDEAWTINKWTGNYTTWSLNGIRTRYPVIYFTNVLKARGDRLYVLGNYRVQNDSVTNTLLAEISPNGNVIRDTVFTEPAFDTWIEEMIYDVDSNFLLGGYKRLGKDTSTANAIVQKVDTLFNIIWEKQYTGKGMNVTTQIEPVNDSTFVVCGLYDYYSIENMLNPLKDHHSGTFYLMIDSSGSDITSNPRLPSTSPSVFPNPGTSHFIVPSSVKWTEVFDLNGRKVYEGNSSTIDISEQAQGLYFFKLHEERNTSLHKVVKL